MNSKKKYIFSVVQKLQIFQLFKNGATVREIAKIFGCSYFTMQNILIINFEKEYKKIAKKHLRETCRKNFKKYNFSAAEKDNICKLFKNNKTTTKISQIFKCSGTTIIGILISFLGEKEYRKIGKEHVKKGGLKHNGENCPLWRGGKFSMDFEKTHGISPKDWKKVAQEVRKRDKFICQYCGRKKSTLVHHIIPRYIKIDNSFNNLITLCRSCHPKIEYLTTKYLKENRDPIELFYEKWNT